MLHQRRLDFEHLHCEARGEAGAAVAGTRYQGDEREQQAEAQCEALADRHVLQHVGASLSFIHGSVEDTASRIKAGTSRMSATRPSPRIVDPDRPDRPSSPAPSDLMTACRSPYSASTAIPARPPACCTTSTCSRCGAAPVALKRSRKRR